MLSNYCSFITICTCSQIFILSSRACHAQEPGLNLAKMYYKHLANTCLYIINYMSYIV